MNPGAVLACLVPLWLLALFTIIAYRCLTGRISLAGLLRGADQRVSPARLQLLVTTIGALGTFALTVLQRQSMNEVPDSLVVLMLGSHAAYLAGKKIVKDKSN